MRIPLIIDKAFRILRSNIGTGTVPRRRKMKNLEPGVLAIPGEGVLPFLFLKAGCLKRVGRLSQSGEGQLK
jgi:hypothetical protein